MSAMKGAIPATGVATPAMLRATPAMRSLFELKTNTMPAMEGAIPAT
jgi:hypothetical protein